MRDSARVLVLRGMGGDLADCHRAWCFHGPGRKCLCLSRAFWSGEEWRGRGDDEHPHPMLVTLTLVRCVENSIVEKVQRNFWT